MTTDIDAAPGTPTPRPRNDSHHLELPFAWEDGPAPTDDDDRDAVFRFPAADDPRPGSRRLLAMSLYASMLGTLILAVAAHTVLSVMVGSAPGWPPAALSVAWLSSVVLVIAAFLSIHRRRLPWVLLLGSTLPLTATVAIALSGR